jgi:hypothetical protein
MKRISKVAAVSGITGALVLSSDAATAQTSALAGSGQPAQNRVREADSPIIPPILAVPPGQNLVAAMKVDHGSQVYTCTNGAYTLLEPSAVLRSGDQLALHTRGPEWVSANDGSAVVAEWVASSPSPGAVPRLLLHAITNRGTGLFGNVDYIQRLNTIGGVAPTDTCTAGDQVSVPYQALYRFYVPAHDQN